MGQTVRLGKINTLICKIRMEIYFGFMIFYFLFCYLNFFIFYLAFILLVTSSESPSDGDLLGSLLFIWYESPPEPQFLKLLQRPRKDEGVWGVGGMMPREWLMTMRVCGVWVGEGCRGP